MAFSKEYILGELRRIASESGGKAPGLHRFANETGIRKSDWFGRHWARWSDAIRDAGLDPNAMVTRIDDGALLAALLDETRRLGSFPTEGELRMRRRTDPTFPSHWSIQRLGNKQALVELLRRYCQADPEGNADVLAILDTLPEAAPAVEDDAADDETATADATMGYVYLIRSGRHYKIGRSNALGRRERELAIQLPERAKTVHVITTDDPVGIERYWHERFAGRRVRKDAEWFSLTPEDVAVFRRRKFQ